MRQVYRVRDHWGSEGCAKRGCLAPRKDGYEFCERHAAGKPPIKALCPAPKRASTQRWFPHDPDPALDTWVYFIQESSTMCVKIGKTTKPVKVRLNALKTSTPTDLELLCAVLGPDWLERRLHEICSPWHHRGEWFKWAPDVQSMVHAFKRHDGQALSDVELQAILDAAAPERVTLRI